MANPYEGQYSPHLNLLSIKLSSNSYPVEHNIKDKPKGKSRRPDMSTFFSQLSNVETSSPSHHNPHAEPTPVEVVAAYNLLRQQYESLLQSAPITSDPTVLNSLISSLETQMDSPPTTVSGVPQSYLDELERVPKKALKKGDTCPICAEKFLDDEYPLVVVLPCHKSHRFDLDCVGPWLRLNGTCPLDRKELMKKKEVIKVPDDYEEEFDDMYA
ncbi:uncharacterized protein PAC_01916 [Phialocephala subalpina]|uniref:RING-type domain-containing protein n=1 Tax=Phialocephala subalpina TaxID=576137 RepID=A0A1L7WGZ4_9HELO|nr:uncharacterized protein PAC_01916 [Phialocephala subalpina]